MTPKYDCWEVEMCVMKSEQKIIKGPLTLEAFFFQKDKFGDNKCVFVCVCVFIFEQVKRFDVPMYCCCVGIYIEVV